MASLQKFLDDLHSRYRTLNDGSLASYIPELTKADPDWFGISVVTAAGQTFEAGDTRQNFTIQSISKVFAYQGCFILNDSFYELIRTCGFRLSRLQA